MKPQRIIDSALGVSGAERADDQFFAALLTSDVRELDAVLADDFLIVEIVGGSVVDRDSFITGVGSGLVHFDVVDVRERRTRRHRDAAIVVGRTEMSGSVEGAAFAVTSRYTHVFVRDDDGAWRLISAQGTPIAEEERRREPC